MALGSVLLKPQPVATPLPPQTSLDDAIVDLIEVFARNPEGAAAAAEVAARIVPEQLEIFVRGFEEKIRLGEGRARQLFRPFGAALDPLLAGVNSGRFVDVLAGVLQALAALLEQLRSDKLTPFIRELAEVLKHDLGLSAQTLRDLATTLATTLIAELQREFIQGGASRSAVARYEFGAVLAGFKSLLDEEQIELPGLGVEAVVDAVMRLWARGRIDALLNWIGELLAHRDDLLAPLAAVIEARVALKVEVRVGGGERSLRRGAPAAGPPRAAVRPRTSTRSRAAPRDGTDTARSRAAPRDSSTTAPLGPIPGHDPAQPIAWYASWVAARTLRYSADDSQPLSRFKNAELVGFAYKHVSAPTMEKLAFHTAWAMPAVEALCFHMISLEKGDVLSNLHIIVLDAIDFGLALGDKGPIPAWWHWTIKPVMTMFLWGFESGWSRVGADNDPYVWTNAAGDLGEMLLYWRWSRLARELVLSFITLLNHEPGQRKFIEPVSGQPAVRNVERYEGICYTFWEIGSMIVPAIFAGTKRENYGFVGGGPTGAFWGIAFGGFAVAAAFGYLSIFLARWAAGEFFDSKLRYGLLLGRDRLYGPYRFQKDFSSFGEGADSIGGWLGTPLGFLFMLATSIGDAPIYTYLFADGDTDDGRFCADTNGSVDHGLKLQGYPSADASPYRLPWEGEQQCVQGNMGVWSHYPDASSQQAYAYDFSHDVGTPILCSRAGVITQLRDNQPDNNPNNWNFVEVLHLGVDPPGGGLGAVAAPAPAGGGTLFFADGVTAVPAGTLFPPYWDAAGAPLPGLPNPMPLHPSAAILPGATDSAPGALAGLPAGHYYENLNGFPLNTTFAFLVGGVDRGIAGRSAGATFADGSAVVPADGVVAPDIALPPPPGTAVFAAGTSFGYDGSNALRPIAATFGVYGHCLFGFLRISAAAAPGTAPNTLPGGGQTPRPSGLPDVYRSGTVNQVLGLFVPQGRVIALSGDTGISAYNHLHTQVYARSSSVGFGWTLPFAYNDVRHRVNPHGFKDGVRGDGVPRSFNFYDSANVRIDPS